MVKIFCIWQLFVVCYFCFICKLPPFLFSLVRHFRDSCHWGC